MKELRIAPPAVGVRRWHGDEFTTIQADCLDPLQAIVKRAGSCVIDGCVVTGSPGSYAISAGIVGIDHPDGYKVARFAGATGIASLPVYLSISKTTTTKVYDVTLNTGIAAELYTAVMTTTVPAGASLTIGSGGGRQFARALVQSYGTDWVNVPVNVNSGMITGNLIYRKNDLLECLFLRATLNVNTSLIPVNNGAWPLLTLPPGFAPNQNAYFQGHLNNQNFLDTNNGGLIRYLTCYATGSTFGGAADVFIHVIQSTANYPVRINAILPLN